jgi:hypothetical protein
MAIVATSLLSPFNPRESIMPRKSARASRADTRRRLPPPAVTPTWEDPIDRALAQMLTSPDPLQRAIATRLILTEMARSSALH